MLFIRRMHARIGMVKNTWKAISHLSGYTFNQITIFIEVACIKRKIHAQILMDQRETSKGKIKKINVKVPLQPMDRKRRINTAHTSIQRILIWNTGKLSTMHASTMNTSSRLFKAAGLRWRRPLILGSRWDLSAWSQWAAKVKETRATYSYTRPDGCMMCWTTNRQIDEDLYIHTCTLWSLVGSCTSLPARPQPATRSTRPRNLSLIWAAKLAMGSD